VELLTSVGWLPMGLLLFQVGRLGVCESNVKRGGGPPGWTIRRLKRVCKEGKEREAFRRSGATLVERGEERVDEFTRRFAFSKGSFGGGGGRQRRKLTAIRLRGGLDILDPLRTLEEIGGLGLLKS